MAFIAQNFALASGAGNQPLTALTLGGFAGCFREYNYFTQDSQQLVVADGYFNSVANVIATGDYVGVYSTLAGVYIRYRLTNTNNVISAVAQNVTLENTVTLTDVQIASMFTTPIQILPSLGTIYTYSVQDITVVVTFGTTSLSAGGSVGLQYGTAAGLTGIAASSVQTGSQVRAIAANSIFTMISVPVQPALSGGVINQGVFISNGTNPYTDGAGMTWRVTVKSSVIKVI